MRYLIYFTSTQALIHFKKYKYLSLADSEIIKSICGLFYVKMKMRVSTFNGLDIDMYYQGHDSEQHSKILFVGRC